MINLFKNEKTIDKIFLGLAVLCLFLILSLSINAFQNGGDDFNLIIELKQKGILKNCIEGYFNWDGRMLTPAAFIQGFFLVYVPVFFTILLWSCCFFGSGILLFSIINLELELKISKIKKLIFTILLAIILWFGSYKHLSETVYWSTGGVYSFNLLIGAFWIYCFLYLQKNDAKLIAKIGFVLLSFIAGSSTQNLSIALISLTIIHIFIEHIENKKTKKTLNFIVLISLILGISYISFAPGNFLRIKAVYETGMPDKTLLYYIKNNTKTILRYGYWSCFLIFFTALLTISVYKTANPNRKINFFIPKINLKAKQNWLSILKNSKWFLVTISTIIPFVNIPELVSFRTSIYFMFFITIFTVIILFKYLDTSSSKSKSIELTYKSNSNIILSTILLIVFSFTIYNFYKSYNLKKAVTERQNILTKAKNKIAYIKLIDPKLNSFCYKYLDFSTNGVESIEWIIESQERYYQTKIVILK